MFYNVMYTEVNKLTSNVLYYYMTSDNVFSDWLTSLETFFDITLYLPHAT